MRWILLVVLLLGCNQRTPLGVGGSCDLARSSDACLRCQARECASAIDSCYGARFRLGHDLPPCPPPTDARVTLTTYFSNDPRYEAAACDPGVTMRCRWNEAGQAYDKDCVPSSPEDCAAFTRCYARCGCGGDCARTCAGEMTAACSTCVQRASACRSRFCASDCGS